MKIIQTVILALAVLISMFFAVYGQIQASRKQENEWLFYKELKSHQDTIMKKEREIAELKRQLENCSNKD